MRVFQFALVGVDMILWKLQLKFYLKIIFMDKETPYWKHMFHSILEVCI